MSKFDIKHELGIISPRRQSGFLLFRGGCCVILLIIFTAVLLFILVQVAKTGIVNIPFISDYVYKVPQPTRSVDDEYAKPNIEFNQTGTGTVMFEISEETLTYYIRQSLQNNEYFAPSAQAAISQNGIEFFGFMQKPARTSITIVVVPFIVNGTLAYDIRDVKIGNSTLPVFMISAIQKTIEEKFAMPQFKDIQFKTIELEDRKIIATVESSAQGAIIDYFPKDNEAAQ